jgi:hypothetical protein
MATTAASAPPAEAELSLLRLNLLRAIYLLIALGEGSQVIPILFNHEPTSRGVIPAFLSGLCLMCLLGLPYPKAMLPLLMFEMAWKYLWFFAFGLPQYLSGQLPPTFAEDFPAITFGVVIMPFVIPWPYVWRTFVLGPGGRWR